MALLLKRRKPKDTIKKFETVAELKYQAGLKLIEEGHNNSGVELLAYATEMWLKSAYVRVVKGQTGLLRTTSEVTGQHLHDAANEAIKLDVISKVKDAESYHSLLFWATLLVKQRKSQARPLQPIVEQELLDRANQLHRM